ncbi:MAG: hypothetical protein U0W24_19995 [Bacteroidales bacterium]
MKELIVKYIRYRNFYTKLILLVFIACIFSKELYSQIASYSNEYLNIGTDASSLSRGNAVVATVAGVNAGYYNPSGLVSMTSKYEVSLMHTNYFSGLAQYDYAGISYKPGDSLAIGFSMLRFGVDDIPNTLNLVDENGNIDYDRITYFSVADYGFFFSLARKSKIKQLQWGASIKFIYRRQGEFASAYGFGFDLGLKYEYRNWKFGAALRDATSTFNFWIFNSDKYKDVFLATNNEIPDNSLEIALPALFTGFAREFKLSDKFFIVPEIDLDFHFDGMRNSLINSGNMSIDPHMGVQANYLKNVYLRFGFDKFQLVEDFDKNKKLMVQPSFGVGFSVYNFFIDYALTDVGDLTVSPVSHIFSLKYNFGKNQ